MSEFYVTYLWNDERHLAIVVAPNRPARLSFDSSAALYEAMDALGDEWELWASLVISQELSEEQLAEMSRAGELKKQSKPDWPLFGGGASSFGVPEGFSG